MTEQETGTILVQQEAITPSSEATDNASGDSNEDNAGSLSYCNSVGGSVHMEQRLYVISRSGSGEASYLLVSPEREQILSYRLKTEMWKPIQDRINFGVAVVQNALYIIGGFDCRQARHLNRVVKFDPSEGTWAQCASLNVARAKFGVCVSGQKIFVCGGEKSDGRVTGSCEMYDPEADAWSKVGRLPEPRANPVCASHCLELYCAGGYFGNTSHKNLWIYEAYRWGEVDQHYPHLLPACLDRCALAVHDNTFYFLGGVIAKSRDASERPRFITERRAFSYTTNISAISNSADPQGQSPDIISPWNFKLPPMNYPRHSAGAVTLGDKIYVVGGTTLETGQQVRVVEYLNTRTGLWEEDFNIRKGDVSNVTCVLLAVPKIPVSERKMAYRLKWVMW